MLRVKVGHNPLGNFFCYLCKLIIRNIFSLTHSLHSLTFTHSKNLTDQKGLQNPTLIHLETRVTIDIP